MITSPFPLFIACLSSQPSLSTSEAPETPEQDTMFQDTVPADRVCALTQEGNLPLADEAAFIAQGASESAQREICTAAMHATAGARETTIEVHLEQWEGHDAALISVTDLTHQTLAEPTLVEAGEGIEVSLQQTGEVFIHLEPVDPDEATNDYSISVECIEGCEATYTRYPVVFFHGLGGGNTFGDIDYFYRVLEVLEPEGYALHTPAVQPFSTIEIRAAEWEDHLDVLVAEGAGRRFNLIAHSQGGLDARYLVGGLGRADLIASIVTVGTPHHGTLLADLLYGTVEDGYVDQEWVDLGATAFAEFYGLESEDQSLVDAMGSLTLDNVAAFNEDIPDDDSVYYASWAGVSCGALEFDCQEACGGEIVDPLLATLHFILWLYDQPNDGMVSTESAIWGDHQGEICADHADEVGLFADTANDAFDHLSFYQDELIRLAELGF